MTNVLLTPTFYSSPPKADGTVNALGKVYFYTAGTMTPKDTYDQDGSTNANPVVLNAAGCADIWITGSYYIEVKTADDVTIATTDNVVSFSAGTTLDSLSDALYDTSVDNNMIIGRNTALSAGAKFNVFIGEGAGSTNSTSATDNNTCVGYNAGTAITSGATNTIIGSTAGDAITTATGTVAIGHNAGGSLTTGGGCTAVGKDALANQSTATNSTAVGNGALFSSTGASCTALGVNAGFSGTANVGGSTNTFIGFQSGADGASYTNGTTIGANSRLTASNTIQLGDSSVTQVICGTANTASIRALNTAKAWGSVSVSAATPTLDESFNLTSITDTSTGQLTVTIATDMSTATYAVITGAELTATSYAVANDRKVYVRFGTQAVGAFDLDCIDSTAVTNVVKDPETWYFSVLGKH